MNAQDSFEEETNIIKFICFVVFVVAACYCRRSRLVSCRAHQKQKQVRRDKIQSQLHHTSECSLRAVAYFAIFHR